MDIGSINSESSGLSTAVDDLSPADRQHLQQFLVNETQKAQIQGTIHALTSTCFKKCITSKISSTALDKYEEPCMRNCVDRYMDAQMSVLTALQKMQASR